MTADEAIRVEFLPTARLVDPEDGLIKATTAVKVWPAAARSNAKPHITLVADDGFLDALDQLRMWHEIGRPTTAEATAREANV